jgi:hypothetical protein
LTIFAGSHYFTLWSNENKGILKQEKKHQEFGEEIKKKTPYPKDRETVNL